MPQDTPTVDWYLAQVKPNSVRIAERNLKRQGFQTFLPVENQTRQRQGRFVESQQPMFPGYIFVALDTSQGMWRKVNGTFGITRLVSFGSAPARVPSRLVAALQARCDADGLMMPEVGLKPGDQVTVTQGPFAQTIAEIERVAPDQRVWVLIDLMGRRTRTAMDPAQLRALSA